MVCTTETFFKMTTGDLKNNLRKLHSELKLVSYSGQLDIEGLSVGKPSAFLPLLHFVLTEFSLDLAQYFYSKGYELLGKNDMKFVQVLYRILRDEFSAKATVTKEQFFTLGFAERKLQLVTLVFKICRTKNEALKPHRKIKPQPCMSNTGKTTKNKLHDIQGKTSNESKATIVNMSESVAMDAISRNFNSEKILNDSYAVPAESQLVNYMEDAVSSHVSKEFGACNTGSVSLPFVSDMLENVKKCSVYSRKLLPSTYKKQVMRRDSQNSLGPCTLPYTGFRCANNDEGEGGNTELNDLPLVAPDENTSPNTSYNKIDFQKSHNEGFSVRFSPIPLTKTNQDFGLKCRTESNQNKTDTPFQNYKGCAFCTKDVYCNQNDDGNVRNSAPGNQDLTQHHEKSTITTGSAVIVECLKRQQNHIEKLQREVKKRDIHVQELTQKNSELCARVMVLETTVALLQEKINE